MTTTIPISWLLAACLCLLPLAPCSGQTQTAAPAGTSDKAAPVKMNYVYSMEEAQRLSYQKKKPIFFNCYAGWAAPCQAMDLYVFNDEAFCAYMDKHFVNLFIDMTTPKGKELAQEYGVYSYACYLILNYKGEEIHRVARGGRLPGFREEVALALDHRTSLAGAAQKYRSGKYKKEDVYRYLNALRVARKDSLFRRIGKEYMAMLTPKEFPEKKNWILARLYKDRQSEFYRYLVAHKEDFVRTIGREEVDGYIESCFSEVLGYATGDTEYDGAALDALFTEMHRGGLPDTCLVSVVGHIGRLRGERKFGELLRFMDENGRYLAKERRLRALIELSFNFPDITPQQKQELSDYLQRASQREVGNDAKRLAALSRQVLEAPEGIVFSHDSFAGLQQKAAAGGRLLFVDCYTSWCGPCRSMANNVFTRKEVGAYFNSRFVCAKINMEKGEGVELGKRYQVSAYPTLLFLDATGKVLKKVVGYKTPEQLLELAAEVAQ